MTATTTETTEDVQQNDPDLPVGHFRNDDGEIVVDPRYKLALELREKGSKVRYICRAAGISMTTYYHWFPRTDTREVREAAIKQMEEMNRLRKLGMTDADIARKFKTSRQRINMLLGPRGKHPQHEMVTVIWRTSSAYKAEVEKVARRAGATYGGGENDACIKEMLNQIATGDLIVTAAPSRVEADVPDYLKN